MCALFKNPVQLVAAFVLGFPQPPVFWTESFQEGIGIFNWLRGNLLKHRVSFIPFFYDLFRAYWGWRLVNPVMAFYEADANGCQDKKCMLCELLTIVVVHDKSRQVGETSDFSSLGNRLTIIKQRTISQLYYTKRT